MHRILLTVAAGVVTLAVGAAPALAGSDGCSGDDCIAENAPPPVVPIGPLPVADQPLPAASPAPERARPRTRRTRTRTVGVAQRTVPRGAVAAGAGGTAPDSPDGLIVAGALVLTAAGAGLVVARRRAPQ